MCDRQGDPDRVSSWGRTRRRRNAWVIQSPARDISPVKAVWWLEGGGASVHKRESMRARGDHT